MREEREGKGVREERSKGRAGSGNKAEEEGGGGDSARK